MTEQRITLYPGDSITIDASAGQADEPGDGDAATADGPSASDGSDDPSAGTPPPAEGVVQPPDPTSVGVTGPDETPADEGGEG